MNTAIGILFYALIGGITSACGITLFDWEYWAILSCVFAIDVNSAIGARK